ncbi:hypothetical protein ABXW33_26945, partial [Klebsiella pneumoniae]
DRNRSHWSTSKTPSYTKSVSWQHHLLSNPKARVEMGIKGRKRIQDKFSSGMIISKTLKTYHDVVEG